MHDKKYTDGDAVDIIENEGLEYAVRHYCDGTYFESGKTGSYWTAAQRALNNLVDHLREQTGRDI